MKDQVQMFENLETDIIEKPKVNNVQENLIYFMEKNRWKLTFIQKETSISFSTLWTWYTGSAERQLLDINIKELADLCGVTVDQLAFSDCRKEVYNGTF